MTSVLHTERIDDALVLTISDPATRNTLSEQVISAGIEALDVAESDAQLRCVILRGDGGHFCAGGNLNGLAQRREEGRHAQHEMLEQLHHLVQALRTFPKPVIAAVEGAAAGAGFSLALACDLIVAAEDARFTLSYARIGLTPDAGATWHLARALPAQLVRQMVWLAEPVAPETLQRFGLVNWVVAKGAAYAEALKVAQRLRGTASNAVTSAKELLQQVPGNTLDQQLAAERDAFVDALFHPNAAEGMAAFFDKRPARFH